MILFLWINAGLVRGHLSVVYLVKLKQRCMLIITLKKKKRSFLYSNTVAGVGNETKQL